MWTLHRVVAVAGMPEIELALNEDLVIGAKPGAVGYGRVGLDDVNFHECVRLDRWDRERTLVMNPPDGEVAVRRRTSRCLLLEV